MGCQHGIALMLQIALYRFHDFRVIIDQKDRMLRHALTISDRETFLSVLQNWLSNGGFTIKISAVSIKFENLFVAAQLSIRLNRCSLLVIPERFCRASSGGNGFPHALSGNDPSKYHYPVFTPVIPAPTFVRVNYGRNPFFGMLDSRLRHAGMTRLAGSTQRNYVASTSRTIPLLSSTSIIAPSLSLIHI